MSGSAVETPLLDLGPSTMAFLHRVFYNEDRDRVEMHLVSQAEQEVTVGGEAFDFAEGETICTEYSHKYTIEGFARIAAQVEFNLRRSWTDDRRYFAVLHLVVTGSPPILDAIGETAKED